MVSTLHAEILDNVKRFSSIFFKLLELNRNSLVLFVSKKKTDKLDFLFYIFVIHGEKF